MNLTNLNAIEILKLFNSNKLSAVEYVSELISHIKLREPNVEAWAFLNEDLVKTYAKTIDEKRSNNLQKSFAGIPIGIKDIIDTRDFPTENGSKTCLGRKPKKDAHLVKLLRENDIIILVNASQLNLHYQRQEKQKTQMTLNVHLVVLHLDQLPL